MKVLLVGAGAVGQIYGWHLQQAGVQIAYLIKDKYAMAMRRGLTLYGLNRDQPWEAIPFYGYETLQDVSEVRKQRWDQVWLCVSSTALKGDWLPRLLDATGDATIVSLQPGLEDQRYLKRHVGCDRLVTGLIGFIAYQAPLKREPVERVGTAFYFPPFISSMFSGPKAPVKQLIDSLKMSRLPCRKVDHVAVRMARASAVLMPMIVGLEASGWSLKRFRSSETLSLACSAAREAQVVVAHYHGVRPAALRYLVRGWLFTLGIMIAPRLVPFPLETYLKIHFTKVREQSQSMLKSYQKTAEESSCDHDALTQLYTDVFQDWPENPGKMDD